jgi:hypothetical protein
MRFSSLTAHHGIAATVLKNIRHQKLSVMPTRKGAHSEPNSGFLISTGDSAQLRLP